MQKSIRTKKELEILLQKLERPERYKNGLEQYPTDAYLASYILFIAYLDGNIAGKTVADLGSGNGIFAVGSLLLGAARSYSVEIDPDMWPIIERNSTGLDSEVVRGGVSQFSTEVDTVIMNPPFGSVRPGADREFLEKATELARHVYAIHNSKSADFVRNYYLERGEIIREEKVKVQVPMIYRHHTRANESIPAVFFHVLSKH